MKRSGYMQRMQQKRAEDDRNNYVMARQLMADLLTLTLAQDFKFTPDKLKKAWDSFAALHDEFCGIWNEDSRDVEYTKAVLDRELKKVCGEYFVPWEERYRV